MIPLDVSIERDGRAATIAISGELDLATISTAREAVEQALPGSDTIVLDLTGVGFIDSTGLGLIAFTAQQIGERLTVIPSPVTRRLLDLTGMSDHLTLRMPGADVRAADD
jgi:anti-sigma B factor antagonist